MTAADAASGLDVTLAGLFRYKKYAAVKAAYERGRFLRELEDTASVVETVSEAARKLKLSSGAELRGILDSDAEAADIWQSRRLATRIETRKGLIAAAAAGNQAAIRVVENYLKDDQAAPAGSDLTKLMQKEIAELFDVNRVTVNDWTNRHKMPRNADGSYNLYEIIRWYGEFARGKATGRMPTADTLRELKAEEKKLDIAARRGELLDRQEVIAGLVGRYQQMVTAFTYKRRQLATMCHNQTVENIEDILGRFFGDIRRKQLELPDFLDLPEAAEKKLVECFEILATEGTVYAQGEHTEG